MKCLITGTETNNKWRGHPLCRDIIDLAREMREELANGGRPLTTRQALVKLGEQWKKRINEEVEKLKGDK